MKKQLKSIAEVEHPELKKLQRENKLGIHCFNLSSVD